jgi:hypothetical protein
LSHHMLTIWVLQDRVHRVRMRWRHEYLLWMTRNASPTHWP